MTTNELRAAIRTLTRAKKGHVTKLRDLHERLVHKRAACNKCREEAESLLEKYNKEVRAAEGCVDDLVLHATDLSNALSDRSAAGEALRLWVEELSALDLEEIADDPGDVELDEDVLEPNADALEAAKYSLQ